MALNLGTEYPSNTTPADANYPYASAKNESVVGAKDGFPGEKAWFNDFLGFFQGLLTRAGITPSGNPDTVLASDYHDALDGIIAASVASKNAVVDGGMLVGAGAIATLTGSYQYGACPLIAGKVDGTVTSGTLEQVETTLLGKSGFACLLKDVTTGAGGIVYTRYRIESKDVQRFIDQAALVHCRVYHDVGSSINYTITVNKANAQDDFSTVTNISTSGSLAVNTGAETQISFAIADMATCGNGVEIIISASTGAITTKDFYLTELMLHTGAVISPFPYDSVQEAEIGVLRYFERWVSSASSTITLGIGQCTSTSVAEFVLNITEKRATPVGTTSAISTFEVIGGSIAGTITLVSVLEYTKRNVNIWITVSGTPWTSGNAARFKFDNVSTGYIQLDARL
jgi:hypothetical protein